MTSEPTTPLGEAPPATSLRATAVRGAIATGASQAVRVGIQFISVVILARLLEPGAFGVFAMVAPIVSLATLLQDFGLANAIITPKTITDEEVGGIFRLNLVISAALALILAAASPLLAWVYHEPQVVPVTLLACVHIVFVAGSAVQLALLARTLKFFQLAAIEISAAVTGILVAMAVAWKFGGPWALVAQLLASSITTLAVAWIWSGWTPTRFASLRQLRPMLRFGSGMTGFNLANYVSRNADNLLIGWHSGSVQLGYYDRAYKILLFPILQVNAPFTKFMIPILSRIQDDPGRFRSTYVRILRVIMMITGPLMVFLIATADHLIPFLLGEHWRPTIQIFRWLGLVGAFQILSNTFGWLFITQGRVGELARLGFFNAITSVASFVVGLHWGAVGVAAAYGLSGLLLRFPLNLWAVGRQGNVSTRDILYASTPQILGAAAATAAWLGLQAEFPTQPIAYLAISGVLIYATNTAVLLMIPGTRAIITDLVLSAWRRVSSRRAA